MTLKHDVAQLTIMVDDLNKNVLQLAKAITDIKHYNRETQISMAANVQDLHMRLEYIKSYIGVDVYFNEIGRQRYLKGGE